MPLETVTFASELVPTNPAHTDGLNQADAHIRLVKGSIKATFPNFTAAPLNSSQAQIDSTVSKVLTNGADKLAASVAFPNAGDTLTSPAAGEVDLSLGGAPVSKWTNISGSLLHHNYGSAQIDGSAAISGALAVQGNTGLVGNLTVAGKITGPGSVPIGAMMMWLSDTLPADGNWCWANGGTLSRTGNGAALYALWGTTYGVGDNVTTFNVINMQEVVPVGKSTMGGAGSPGLLPSMPGSVKAFLNGAFGVDQVALAAGHLPPHTHGVYLRDPGHAHSWTGAAGAGGSGFAGGGGTSITAQNTAASFTGLTIGSVPGVANDNLTTAGPGSSVPITNIQPSRVVNFIIRIA